MKRFLPLVAVLLSTVLAASARTAELPSIEVSGSATIYIVPDRITIEIGMEEYHAPQPGGDSMIVAIADIERGVRSVLRSAGVADSLIEVSDVGNYRNRDMSSSFLMAKRLSATVTDLDVLDNIARGLDRKGISSFNITKIDNSDMGLYNRRGLKSALDAARDKAVFIAQNEGLTLLAPIEIVETTGGNAGYAAFSNAAFDAGTGLDNMRRIARRYSVKVRYAFSTQK